MGKQFKLSLTSGFIGFLSGLLFFTLEMTIRLIYLFFWTFEKAPMGYLQFMIYYSLCGFIIGSFCPHMRTLLLSVMRIKRKSLLAGVIIVILSLLVTISITIMQQVKTTRLNLNDIIMHLGIIFFICSIIFLITWYIIRLRNKYKASLFLVGYGLLIASLIAINIILLQSFSWERVFVKTPKSNTNVDTPNILLLTVDTLRADRLGAYGYHKKNSPNIDLLAKEGTLFEHAISQSPWTRPSYASMLTSLYPSQTGAFTVNDPAKGYHEHAADFLYDERLLEDAVTLTEICRDNGYTTIAFQTNWQSSEVQNFDQGFQLFLYNPLFTINMLDRSIMGTYGRWLPSFIGLRRKLPFWTLAPTAVEAYEAFNGLANKGFPQPFFIWINLMDPHAPYIVREKGVSIDKSSVVETFDSFDSNVSIYTLSNAYDDEVLYVDYYIGKILNLLKDNEVLENTIIIFLSDHGEEFGEHMVEIKGVKENVYGRHHGQSLYNELLHVPMIIRYPSKIPQGLRVKEFVRLIDVMPTVAELAGIKEKHLPENIEGVSLLPLIKNGKHPLGRLPCFSERVYFGLEQKAIQYNDYKMILHVENGDLELYDLKSDPREKKNLAKLQHEESSRLQKELNVWLRKIGPLIPSSKGSSKASLSKEDIERLKALGYMN